VPVQAKILKDYSPFGGAIPNIFKQPGLCAGGVSSKCKVDPKKLKMSKLILKGAKLMQ